MIGKHHMNFFNFFWVYAGVWLKLPIQATLLRPFLRTLIRAAVVSHSMVLGDCNNTPYQIQQVHRRW